MRSTTTQHLWILLLLVVFAACNKDGTIVDPGPTLLAPTNLRAYSASATSVGLRWDLSATESDPAFNNYLIRVKSPGGALVGSVSVSKGNPQAFVTGLAEGVIYTFVVRSTNTSSAESADSVSIRWSPARRYTVDSLNGPPIQVYEFNSTSGASGLQFNSSGAYARTRSLSISNPDRVLCDMYLATSPSLSLRNVATPPLSYPRNTFFSSVSRDAVSLDDPQLTPPDSTTYLLNAVDIPLTTGTQSKVFYGYSATDNKYVRILVLRNPATNLLYYGSGSDRYVILQLSYQNAAGNPYSRGHRLGIGRQ